MSFDFSGEKLRLIYPCQWGYKVIGSGQEKLRRAIAEVLREQIYTVSLSNRSKTGKYCCLNLETEVHSEENRTQIYTALQNHPAIRIVL
jgi:putative lipoic acid-binding regulatory protein